MRRPSPLAGIPLSTPCSDRASLPYTAGLQWYWARTRDKASHDPMPIPLGYRGLWWSSNCVPWNPEVLRVKIISRNVSPSEQEEDERRPMPTSVIKDLLKKWADVRVMVLEWHPNQADVSRVGDLYNNNAINYFRKILKKREKQSTLDMFFNAP
ncbi:uncharacterized protein TNCV_477451 [Trichonephila clavipes]|nr:uncharacterized protein TNCV_477451 [Trichonephila clavipes]